MPVAFTDLYQQPTPTTIKARVIALCQAFGLIVTAWILGSPSERWVEIISRVIDAFTSGPLTASIRGFFFDLATDPGDPGDLSADQTPRAGFLSALGEGWYGTTRGGATAATGALTITNAGTTPATFGPYDLTFSRATAGSDGGYPTYRNTPDPAIYTGIGGTITLAPSASITIPVAGEQVGSYGTAIVGAISVVVTQSFGTLTASASSAAIGADREARDLYIARCKQAADAASPNGAADAYRYCATTGSNGLPLQRHDGSGQVGITKAFVNADSATGNVDGYFADDDGPIDAVDLASANANITGVALGVITSPTGCVPLGITYTGHAAVATSITVTGTARIKARAGVDSATLKTTAEAAILARLALYFAALEIGGVEQTAGSGFVYTADLIGEIHAAYSGLYAEALSSPSGSSTTIALGHVATLNGASAVTVTVV